MGQFIPENEARAPKTAALLRQIPDVYNAFFSVLEPHQHIDPHWGHYKGYVNTYMCIYCVRAQHVSWLHCDGVCRMHKQSIAAMSSRTVYDLILPTEGNTCCMLSHTRNVGSLFWYLFWR